MSKTMRSKLKYGFLSYLSAYSLIWTSLLGISKNNNMKKKNVKCHYHESYLFLQRISFLDLLKKVVEKVLKLQTSITGIILIRGNRYDRLLIILKPS